MLPKRIDVKWSAGQVSAGRGLDLGLRRPASEPTAGRWLKAPTWAIETADKRKRQSRL